MCSYFALFNPQSSYIVNDEGALGAVSLNTIRDHTQVTNTLIVTVFSTCIYSVTSYFVL